MTRSTGLEVGGAQIRCLVGNVPEEECSREFDSCLLCLCFRRMSDSEDSDLEERADVVRHRTKIVSRIETKASGCAEHTCDSLFLTQIYQSQFPYIHMEPPGE